VVGAGSRGIDRIFFTLTVNIFQDAISFQLVSSAYGLWIFGPPNIGCLTIKKNKIKKKNCKLQKGFRYQSMWNHAVSFFAASIPTSSNPGCCTMKGHLGIKPNLKNVRILILKFLL